MSDPRTGPSRPARSTPARRPTPTTGARALPIYQTTSYVFNDTEHAANLFALKEFGNIYTRIMNPTQDAVEQRIATLEGGVGGAARGLRPGRRDAGDPQRRRGRRPHRGQPQPVRRHVQPAAATRCRSSASRSTFVEDPDDLDSWRAAVRPNTKAFFAETIANPKQDVLDIEGVAAVAHEAGVPLIVDNTVATPYLHPAARVGRRHRRALGDEVPRRPRHLDRGRHRRRRQRSTSPPTRSRFPELQHARPELPRPGLRAGTSASAARSGANLAFILKARVQLLRDLGPAISPFNAFLIAQGIETLSLRIERHVENARPVAEWLQEPRRGASRWPTPSLPSTPVARAGRRSTPRAAPAPSLAFEIEGGLEAGKKFVEALTLHSHVANIGDVRSLVIHPASTTHSQLSRRGPGWPPASRRAWCVWPSASSTSTTSSPTSSRASPPPRAPEPHSGPEADRLTADRN